MNFTQALLAHMQAERITHVFGIVGGLLSPFFAALEEDPSFTFVQTKHEGGAAFMADGYARVSGQMACAAATSGPGATNLITGVACAFTDGVPMLVITGQASTPALGKGAAQEANREDVDIVAMFAPITKYSAFVSTAQSLSNHFRRAMREALSGRPGPVHLNIPLDLWYQDVAVNPDYMNPKSYRSNAQVFSPGDVHAAERALLSAKYPVLLVGSGVGISKSEEEILILAETLNARVATTPRAKGLFPEDHPLSLGVFGTAGTKQATETILGDQVDVLFAIGTSLGETSTLSWNPKLLPTFKFIQLDIDPIRIGRNYPVDITLVGDANAILNEMLTWLHRTPSASVWDKEPAIVRDAPSTSIAHPLTPQRWRADLQEVLPDNAIVFSDIGGHMLFNIHNLTIRKGQRFVINLNFGSMGHGVAAAIGAALATDKPVFSIVGDGCFTMNGMEMLTALGYNAPVIWIVENNDMHGITWHCSQLTNDGKPIKASVNRAVVRVADMARAMGLNAVVVDGPNQIQEAVSELLVRGGPGVIEVIVDPKVCPPVGERANALAAFPRSK